MSSRYDKILSRQFVTSDDVRSAAARNENQLTVPVNTTVTEEARELAQKLSISFDESASAPAQQAKRVAQRTVAAPAAPQRTDADNQNQRVVDAVLAVLKEMNLGERGVELLPTITHRVLAGLSANRN